MTRYSEKAKTATSVVLLVSLGLIGVGCSGSLKKKAFCSCAPERIAIVLGHELRSVSRSADDEFLIGFFFGIPGAVLNEASLDRSQVEAGGAVNARLIEAAVAQLEEKGYATCVLARKQIKYKAFEDIGGKPENFDHLCQKYQVQDQLAGVDAIVFLECKFDFRFFEPTDGAQVSLEDVQTRSGQVKTQIFDCDSKQVLFQGAEGIADTRNFNRVAVKLVDLKKIPPKSELH